MQDWLAARAVASPQRLALSVAGHDFTYRDLDAQVGIMAARLAALGLARGDRLGVLLPNGLAYALLIHAAIRLGLVLVPLNTRLTPAEVAWQVEKSRCRVLVAEDDLPLAGCQVITPAALEAVAFSGEPVLDGTVDLEAPLVIVFTSGTTGQPKGAILTGDSLFNSALASAYRNGVLPEDRWLCTLPLYHVGGLSILLRSCLYGTAVELHPRFDLAAVNTGLIERPVTLISLVPTMLQRLLDEGDPDHWSRALRLILLGGAAATPELLARCAALDLPVALTYGLTETASQVATATHAEVRRKPGSVGKPLLFTAVRILDERGHPVPAGTPGEVVVSGPTVMAGYDGEPDATARVLRAGWMHTGDIGYLDEEGDLWLLQRRSDLIVSGGENVYPAEVEAVLRTHPAVAEVCVVGLPDPTWGQQVAAAIVLRAGAAADEAVLIAHCRAQLAGYKLPRRIVFVAALPQTASGKIERKRVLDLFT